jgi:hypothetical protein
MCPALKEIERKKTAQQHFTFRRQTFQAGGKAKLPEYAVVCKEATYQAFQNFRRKDTGRAS